MPRHRGIRSLRHLVPSRLPCRVTSTSSTVMRTTVTLRSLPIASGRVRSSTDAASDVGHIPCDAPACVATAASAAAGLEAAAARAAVTTSAGHASRWRRSSESDGNARPDGHGSCDTGDAWSGARDQGVRGDGQHPARAHHRTGCGRCWRRLWLGSCEFEASSRRGATSRRVSRGRSRSKGNGRERKGRRRWRHRWRLCRGSGQRRGQNVVLRW